MKQLELIVIKSPKGAALSVERVLVGENIISLGRDEQCTLCLPDPERFVSNRHAVIWRESGRFYLEDCSTNGVYVNGEQEPVGMRNSVEMLDGDTFDLGGYRLRVDIYERSQQSSEKDTEYVDSKTVAVDPIRLGQHAVSHSQRHSLFLETLGVDVTQLDLEQEHAMDQLGATLLKESLAGFRELLSVRSRSKSSLDSEMTMIQEGQNNPLKFLPTTEQAIASLFGDKKLDGFQSPVRTIRDSVQDLLDHQLRVEKASEKAVLELMNMLAPEKILEKVDNKSQISEQECKQRCWDIFCQYYNQMMSLFGNEAKLAKHLVSDGYQASEINDKLDCFAAEK